MQFGQSENEAFAGAAAGHFALATELRGGRVLTREEFMINIGLVPGDSISLPSAGCSTKRKG